MLEEIFHASMLKERAGIWLSSMLMKWCDLLSVLTLKGMGENFPGLFQDSWLSCFRWMGPQVLSFLCVIHCFLAYSDLSLFLCPSLPSRPQFISCCVNQCWSFLSSVVTTHNNNISNNRCINSNNINNTKFYFLDSTMSPGPMWNTLHALFHWILITIQFSRDFYDDAHFTDVEDDCLKEIIDSRSQS